jgi:hypothetical protein
MLFPEKGNRPEERILVPLKELFPELFQRYGGALLSLWVLFDQGELPLILLLMNLKMTWEQLYFIFKKINNQCSRIREYKKESQESKLIPF